jgi:Domain of unknown function (DUF4190)
LSDPRISGDHPGTGPGVDDHTWPNQESALRSWDTWATSTPRPGHWHSHTDGFAIASLVCSIVGFVTGLGAVLGIVFGFVARGRIRKSENLTGRGLALSGIIIGFLALTVFLAAIGVLLTSNSDSARSAARSLIVTSGAPGDVTLAEHELLPRSAYPAGWLGGGRGSQNTQANFFGGLGAATASRLATCLGVNPTNIDRTPAEAASQAYENGGATWQVFDTVDVFPTMRGVRADLAAAASPSVEPCELRFLDSPNYSQMQGAVTHTFGADAKMGATTVTHRPLIADNGSQDIDVETAFPIVGKNTNTVFYSDQILVQRGRSESNILILYMDRHPPEIALVNRLARAAAVQMATG